MPNINLEAFIIIYHPVKGTLSRQICEYWLTELPVS
jgi:hypothetical protein